MSTRLLLEDLGVHEDAIDLVWKSVAEDILNHFKLEPRTRRRAREKGGPPRPLPRHDYDGYHEQSPKTSGDWDGTSEDWDGYLEEQYGPRTSYSTEGDELPDDDTPHWAIQSQKPFEVIDRRSSAARRSDPKKKKDHIPVSSLIKDEAKNIKKRANQERREHIVREVTSKDQPESETPRAPAKKRKGTW
jgi:hypothetical protein